MEITTNVIKELRDKTGVSVMQCKKALEEANGDLGQAEVILKKRSSESAEKKAERTLKAGAVGSYIHDGNVGAMVTLFCETDFVAKNPDFISLARDIAMQVTATEPIYVSMETVPQDKIDSAKAVFEKEIADKPIDMQEKILGGKLSSYFKEQVLLEQPFIKDENKTIINLINEATQKFGERIEIGTFARVSTR